VEYLPEVEVSVDGVLNRLRVSRKELVIERVLARVIAFVFPPLSLMLLTMVVLGLLIASLIISVFEPKNVTRLLIVWLIARSAERISERFKPGGIRGDFRGSHSREN